jgi:hypothetical protein
MNMPLSPEKTAPVDDTGLCPYFRKEMRKGIKRKFLERGTSQGPPEEMNARQNSQANL